MHKISTPEAILLIMCGMVADAINWIPVVNWLVGIFMFPVTQIYFRMKGVKGHYAFIGNIVELLPFLSILPAYTLTMAATIYIDRHPKLVAKTAAPTSAIGPKPTVAMAATPTLKTQKMTEVIRRTEL